MERKKTIISLLFVSIALLAIAGVSVTVLGTCQYNSADLRGLYFDCEFQKQWLEELPEMPSNFYDVRNLFQYKFVAFRGPVLNKSYWIQPEWFPNIDENIKSINNALDYEREAKRRPLVVWCVGVYPSDFYAKTKPGRNLTLYVWIKNLPIQRKYEGAKLYPSYPSHAEFEEGGSKLGFREVEQNTSYARDNINIDLSPEEFLLTPAFPKLTENYARMIQVDVRISDKIEPGIYVVGFLVGAPTVEFSQDMRLKYGFGYTDPIGEFACSPRHYNLFIEIE